MNDMNVCYQIAAYVQLGRTCNICVLNQSVYKKKLITLNDVNETQRKNTCYLCIKK